MSNNVDYFSRNAMVLKCISLLFRKVELYGKFDRQDEGCNGTRHYEDS